jgi:hypothetical protein
MDGVSTAAHIQFQPDKQQHALHLQLRLAAHLVEIFWMIFNFRR